MSATTKNAGPLEGAPGVGRVALVGAGPGDPDLLTLKAARLIGEAEILFVDRLVGRRIMPMVNDSAEVVFVGKSKGEHSVPQDQIHQLMVDAARAGKFVVRLKGGDPFVFGRGGEEVLAMREAGLDVEVVPGVSSALGCAAAAQVPLTHRGMAQAVTFVTGHAALGAEPDLDWASLARGNQTVVVFMGVGAAGGISRRLVEAGRAAHTPVAVIENGTRRNEIRAYGRLGELEELIAREGIEGPALLVIGEVAALGVDAFAAVIPDGREADPGSASVRDLDTLPGPASSALRAFVRDDVSEGAPSVSDLWERLP